MTSLASHCRGLLHDVVEDSLCLGRDEPSKEEWYMNTWMNDETSVYGGILGEPKLLVPRKEKKGARNSRTTAKETKGCSQSMMNSHHHLENDSIYQLRRLVLGKVGKQQLPSEMRNESDDGHLTLGRRDEKKRSNLHCSENCRTLFLMRIANNTHQEGKRRVVAHGEIHQGKLIPKRRVYAGERVFIDEDLGTRYSLKVADRNPTAASTGRQSHEQTPSPQQGKKKMMSAKISSYSCLVAEEFSMSSAPTAVHQHVTRCSSCENGEEEEIHGVVNVNEEKACASHDDCNLTNASHATEEAESQLPRECSSSTLSMFFPTELLRIIASYAVGRVTFRAIDESKDVHHAESSTISLSPNRSSTLLLLTDELDEFSLVCKKWRHAVRTAEEVWKLHCCRCCRSSVSSEKSLDMDQHHHHHHRPGGFHLSNCLPRFDHHGDAFSSLVSEAPRCSSSHSDKRITEGWRDMSQEDTNEGDIEEEDRVEHELIADQIRCEMKVVLPGSRAQRHWTLHSLNTTTSHHDEGVVSCSAGSISWRKTNNPLAGGSYPPFRIADSLLAEIFDPISKLHWASVKEEEPQPQQKRRSKLFSPLFSPPSLRLSPSSTTGLGSCCELKPSPSEQSFVASFLVVISVTGLPSQEGAIDQLRKEIIQGQEEGTHGFMRRRMLSRKSKKIKGTTAACIDAAKIFLWIGRNEHDSDEVVRNGDTAKSFEVTSVQLTHCIGNAIKKVATEHRQRHGADASNNVGCQNSDDSDTAFRFSLSVDVFHRPLWRWETQYEEDGGGMEEALLRDSFFHRNMDEEEGRREGDESDGGAATPQVIRRQGYSLFDQSGRSGEDVLHTRFDVPASGVSSMKKIRDDTNDGAFSSVDSKCCSDATAVKKMALKVVEALTALVMKAREEEKSRACQSKRFRVM